MILGVPQTIPERNNPECNNPEFFSGFLGFLGDFPSAR
jgi:hypothetical protein